MMNDILKLVEEFITKQQESKKWIAGQDVVHYAGPYFGTEEYVEAIRSLLNGWLVLGESGIRFEHQFPAYVGKSFGVLTNSGSSSKSYI